MFELRYSCYVRKKTCITSLDITNIDHAIGNDELIPVSNCRTKRYITTAGGGSTNPHKLVALTSNLLDHDDGDGNDTHYKLISYVSALDAIASKIFTLKRNCCFNIADLRQQQRIKLKDTKNELDLWRHIFDTTIIIVTGWIHAVVGNTISPSSYYAKNSSAAVISATCLNCVVSFIQRIEILDLSSGVTTQMAIRYVISFTNNFNLKHKVCLLNYVRQNQRISNPVPPKLSYVI